ncbi:MAG: DNA-directed RNA polymerase subunit alpha [Candidatus Shikimatogenerans sp. JK-2022]|nr:DNA-directed RNA polymerase subunit alpha [Candidatus Shikimatogenerans bostrichidophilus]
MKFKILVLKNTSTLGIFKIFPINNGYGITLGNTLRRILLSSLYGYSVSYFKIKKVLHEFTYIKGIIEDITEIILNLKKIKFKLKKNKKIKKEIINIKINKKDNIFYAGNIQKFTKNFEIINKKLIILNKDNKKKFNIKLLVDRGKGYIPSEKKKKYKKFIPIDSIYTPIINVSYKIINYNQKKIKYNKEILIINILTDGSISPIKALIKSSNILIKIFNLFNNKKNYYKYIKIKNLKKIKFKLNNKFKKKDFSIKTINFLNYLNIFKWKDLIILNKKKLLKIKNINNKILKEIIKKIKSFKNKIKKKFYET